MNSSRCTLVTVMFVLSCRGSCAEGHHDKKRALIFPQPSSEVRVIAGIGLPVDLELETVIIGIVLKGHYFVPTNSTLYTSPSITLARKKRSISRWDVYELLSSMSDAYGHGGRACILRAVCEMAEVPIDRSNGLFEELFHALLTPTTTKEEIRSHSDNEFYAAHQIGRGMKGACQHFFGECRISYVEMFTSLRLNDLD